MDKLQYDSFHKFMVSLGIILITLPIVAYIFLIKSEPIILSQNDFNTLSTFSLKNISEKEHIIERKNGKKNGEWLINNFNVN